MNHPIRVDLNGQINTVISLIINAILRRQTSLMVRMIFFHFVGNNQEKKACGTSSSALNGFLGKGIFYAYLLMYDMIQLVLINI